MFKTYGQSFSLSDSSGNIIAGDTLYSSIANNQHEAYPVYITNNSSSDKDVKVKKTEIEILEGSSNTFCWGVCFTPIVIISPDSILIEAGSTNNQDFYADYNANGNNGQTIIMYTFFDDKDDADSVHVFIKFISSPASVEKYSDNSSTISLPFPNPASTLCNFNYYIASDVTSALLVIMDMLGNKVFELSLTHGENNIKTDVSQLTAGIYFYSLVIDKQPKITRKLLIKS